MCFITWYVNFFLPTVPSLTQVMFFKHINVFLVGQNGMKLNVSMKPEVCAIPSVLVLLLILPVGTARLDKPTEHTPWRLLGENHQNSFVLPCIVSPTLGARYHISIETTTTDYFTARHSCSLKDIAELAGFILKRKKLATRVQQPLVNGGEAEWLQLLKGQSCLALLARDRN